MMSTTMSMKDVVVFHCTSRYSTTRPHGRHLCSRLSGGREAQCNGIALTMRVVARPREAEAHWSATTLGHSASTVERHRPERSGGMRSDTK